MRPASFAIENPWCNCVQCNIWNTRCGWHNIRGLDFRMPSVWMALIQRELKTGFDILLRSGPFALVHTANTDTSSIPHFAIVVGFIAKYFLAHNRLENPLRKKNVAVNRPKREHKAVIASRSIDECLQPRRRTVDSDARNELYHAP